MVRRRSQVAKAVDCKSTIVGSTPTGAFQPEQKAPQWFTVTIAGFVAMWPAPRAYEVSVKSHAYDEASCCCATRPLCIIRMGEAAGPPDRSLSADACYVTD